MTPSVGVPPADVDGSAPENPLLTKLAHDLRSPLNAVIGFAEVLLTETNPPLAAAHRPLVMEILQAGEQLLTVMNAGLDRTPRESRGEEPVARDGPLVHVLIVGGNAVNRRVLSAMLGSARCRVTEAADPATALDVCQGARPDVILLDMQTSEIGAPVVASTIPIVAIVAHEDADRAQAAGWIGYLTRPVGRDNLLAAMGRAMG